MRRNLNRPPAILLDDGTDRQAEQGPNNRREANRDRTSAITIHAIEALAIGQGKCCPNGQASYSTPQSSPRQGASSASGCLKGPDGGPRDVANRRGPVRSKTKGGCACRLDRANKLPGSGDLRHSHAQSRMD